MMAAEQPMDPRTHAVSFDITAPRQQPEPRVAHRAAPAEPDRVQQRLDRLEYRLDHVDAHLAMLASALTEMGNANG
jgi:hypothetical protein